MQKHMLLPLILVWLAMIAPAVAEEPPQVIFNAKVFADLGDIVHVEGTLTGDGIGYKNNRSALTCYRERRECLAIHIDSAGMQVFSILPPIPFTVRLWTADRIGANFAAPCGEKPKSGFPNNPLLKHEWQTTSSDTWIIDRTRETAELIDHPCLGAKTYQWTIEDPPFWKKAKEGQRP
jgi:hypothetical protein